jgi:hypothetical protein
MVEQNNSYDMESLRLQVEEFLSLCNKVNLEIDAV